MYKMTLPAIGQLDSVILKQGKYRNLIDPIELKKNSNKLLAITYMWKNKKKTFRGRLMKCRNRGYYSSIIVSNGLVKQQFFLNSPKISSIRIEQKDL